MECSKMVSLRSMNDTDSLPINFYPVTNKDDDSFVGIRIHNNRIDFYYPETYNLDTSSVDKYRNDVIAILQTISLAKTHVPAKAKIESSFSNNGALPIISYLWIIRDYLMNGFYVNREKILKRNQNGKVDWKRTINSEPIVSKGNIIYNNITVLITNNLDNLIVDIHKYCVKLSIDFLGWLFGINNSNFIEPRGFGKEVRELYIDALGKELNSTYDDMKKMRLSHMLSIIEGLSDRQNQSEIVYGVDSYAYIFERMINSIFGNKDATQFNPSAYWLLEKNNFESIKSSDLRPDTILVKDDTIYILDSKFYRFGYTGEESDLPETTSIQKQITYGDFIKKNKVGPDIKKIRNAFILPYNKDDNKLNLKEKIEYVGYAKADYRNGNDDHEIIHAFLIDLKYVVQTWNKQNHNDDVEALISDIEKIHKEKIKKEKEKEYVESVVAIGEGQSFQGTVLDSFYSTIEKAKLNESLKRKEILFVDGYFVINDKKYVTLVGKKMHLTDYALSNMNECCLAFNSSDNGDSNLIAYDFCRECPSRKRIQSKHINANDKHNEKIFIRAQQCDIDRVVEDLSEDIQLRDDLTGTFGYNLKMLMDSNGFSNNSLQSESNIDGHKIKSLLEGRVKPTIQECVSLCAVFELKPIVSHRFLNSAGYDLQNTSELQYQFYNFLITYCYGEELYDWRVKISSTNHPEWQIK